MTCTWCERPLKAQKSGIYAKRFCSAACRARLHTAARRYGLALVEQGFVSIRQLKETPACNEKIAAARLPKTAKAPR